jgi:3-methylcrotonyl-CoA carboxylase alpha subunit
VAVVEAMKMEHALTAPRAGRIVGIAVATGDQVKQGARLMTIAEPD